MMSGPEFTPEQIFCAVANIINLGILGTVAWLEFCGWLEQKYSGALKRLADR